MAASTDAPAPGFTWLEDNALTYELFESAVAHVDLETCPEGLDPEMVFCRMTLAAEQANVYVFRLDGDQRLMGVRSYELDGDFLPF